MHPSLLSSSSISTDQQPLQQYFRPLQLSALTNLAILYLHGAFSSPAEARLADWDALRLLTSLRFLAISGNRLPALPRAVAQMTQLHVGCVLTCIAYGMDGCDARNSVCSALAGGQKHAGQLLAGCGAGCQAPAAMHGHRLHNH